MSTCKVVVSANIKTTIWYREIKPTRYETKKQTIFANDKRHSCTTNVPESDLNENGEL